MVPWMLLFIAANQLEYVSVGAGGKRKVDGLDEGRFDVLVMSGTFENL